MIYESHGMSELPDITSTIHPDRLNEVVVTDIDMIHFAANISDGENAKALERFGKSLRTYRSAVNKVKDAVGEGNRIGMDVRDIADEWSNSGLMLSSSPEPRIPGIVASSLVDSIDTGRIKTLKVVDESVGVALLNFTQESYGVPHQIGVSPVFPKAEYSNADQGMTPSGILFSDFLQTAFEETSLKKFYGKYLTGPQQQNLLVPLSNAIKGLGALDVHANPAIFRPVKYREPDVNDYVSSLSMYKLHEIEKLGREMNKEMELIGSKINTNEAGVLIPPNLLNDPGYCRQAQIDSCATTNLRMVYKGITGDTLNDSEVINAAVSAHNESILPTESYLNILESDVFRQEYGNRVSTRMFSGMDLSTIAKIAKSVKSRQSAARIFAVVNLISETSYKNVWHNNVLLSAEENTVITHDPTNISSKGKPNRRNDKKDFYRRWAGTGNSGYMVVAT